MIRIAATWFTTSSNQRHRSTLPGPSPASCPVRLPRVRAVAPSRAVAGGAAVAVGPAVAALDLGTRARARSLLTLAAVLVHLFHDGSPGSRPAPLPAFTS